MESAFDESTTTLKDFGGGDTYFLYNHLTTSVLQNYREEEMHDDITPSGSRFGAGIKSLFKYLQQFHILKFK